MAAKRGKAERAEKGESKKHERSEKRAYEKAEKADEALHKIVKKAVKKMEEDD